MPPRSASSALRAAKRPTNRGGRNCARRSTSFRAPNRWTTKVWQEFAANLFYCQGDLTDAAAYQKLEEQLTSFGSAPLRRKPVVLPRHFAQPVRRSGRAGASLRAAAQGRRRGWQRIVVEKPFGHDLASAHALNHELTRYAHEQQVFRIDHYLGKETVQNILMFRFSNSIFERLWNRESVDHVQITVSEKLGVGERGGYYEEAGALRDMVQNHMLQVLVAHRDGTARVARSRGRPRRKSEVAQIHPRADAGRCGATGRARTIFRRHGGRRAAARLPAGSQGEAGFQRGNLRRAEAVH